MPSYDFAQELKTLVSLHPEAYDPSQPYQGVGALFNGDLHRVAPGWAPREDWIVDSPYQIHHIPVDNLSEGDGEGGEWSVRWS